MLMENAAGLLCTNGFPQQDICLFCTLFLFNIASQLAISDMLIAIFLHGHISQKRVTPKTWSFDNPSMRRSICYLLGWWRLTSATLKLEKRKEIWEEKKGEEKKYFFVEFFERGFRRLLKPYIFIVF